MTPSILALALLLASFRKKATVMGIIGKTQGVNIASSPETKARKNQPQRDFLSLSSVLVSIVLVDAACIVALLDAEVSLPATACGVVVGAATGVDVVVVGTALTGVVEAGVVIAVAAPVAPFNVNSKSCSCGGVHCESLQLMNSMVPFNVVLAALTLTF